MRARRNGTGMSVTHLNQRHSVLHFPRKIVAAIALTVAATSLFTQQKGGA